MVEFLSIAYAHRLARGTSGPLLVVYAGSSIMAAIAGCDAFPGTKFVCFDPCWKMTVPVLYRESGDARAAFIMEQRVRTMKQLSLESIEGTLQRREIVFLTDQAGRFSDATCASMVTLHSRMPGYDLAFVSDVRSVVRLTPSQKEVTIASDMAKQADWVRRLGVRYYSLKLRLPFDVTPEIYAKYIDACRAFEPTPHKHDGSVVCDTKLPYLDGRCVLQKYARNMSTEMRLMGVDKPRVTWYDIRSIETAFFPFNTVHRGNTRFAVGSGTTHSRAAAGDLSNVTLGAFSGMIARYSQAIAARDSHASFDELGEAIVLADAARISSAMYGTLDGDISHAFGRVVAGFSSLFEGRRMRA
jgi:hypothetical protein